MMQNLNSQQWKEQIKMDTNAVIIDVRKLEEIECGKLKDALEMDILNPPDFMEKAQFLDKSKNYYVYCRSGARSVQACAVFESLGIKNTFNLEGGISNWDGPIESST